MQRFLASLVVGAMLALAASAGLAAGPVVDGRVTQKFSSSGEELDFRIAVDGRPYDVPLGFYRSVQVGDMVHFDGLTWTITSRGSG